VQNGYSGFVTDYTLTDGSPDVINWTVPPAPGTTISFRIVRNVQIAQIPSITVVPSVGDTIRIVPRHTIIPGDTVTTLFDQFPVGRLGDFQVISVPGPYDISAGGLTLNTLSLGGNIVLNYTQPQRGPNSSSILVRMTEIVDRVRADHTDYDTPDGFETGRQPGFRVLNTTISRVYEWDGLVWNIVSSVFPSGTQVLSLLDQQIVELSGATWNVIFNTGDTFTTPPVLSYPLFGRGIVSGTYALGQTASAATDFPEAYHVMQHAGDYWP